VDGTKAWSISFGRTNVSEVVRDRVTASRTETSTRPDGTQTISLFPNGLLQSVTEKDSVGGTTTVRPTPTTPYNRPVGGAQPALAARPGSPPPVQCGRGRDQRDGERRGALADDRLRVRRHGSKNEDRPARRRAGVVWVQWLWRVDLAGRGQNLSRGVRFHRQGRMATLSTFRNGTNGSPDVTTWNYDPQRAG